MQRVLIVDDSVSIRAMLVATLRDGGFEVVEAEDGEEALGKLRSGPVDLIVTDLSMPVMDGIRLIERVRKKPEMKRTPILMLTTEGGAAMKERGKAAGATGWIMKPFDPEKLMATVAKVLK